MFLFTPMFSMFLACLPACQPSTVCVYHRICLFACVYSFFICFFYFVCQAKRQAWKTVAAGFLLLFFLLYWLCVTFRKFMLFFVFVCTYKCFFLLPYISRFVYSHIGLNFIILYCCMYVVCVFVCVFYVFFHILYTKLAGWLV